MNVMSMYKSLTSQNYRTIINIKNIDVCPIISTSENFPMFKGYLVWFQKTFPGLVHKCPYEDLMILNSSYYVDTLQQQKEKLMFFNPNGMTKSWSYTIFFKFLTTDHFYS